MCMERASLNVDWSEQMDKNGANKHFHRASNNNNRFGILYHHRIFEKINMTIITKPS